jgi:hypothetical protein
VIDATGFTVAVDAATPITPDLTVAERECLARIDSDGVTLTEF